MTNVASPVRVKRPPQDLRGRFIPAILAREARRFRRDESGVMIAYSVFFFLIMLIIGGIGVDFMHYEMERTKLQATLDRAVLAAADVQQERDAAEVVADYLDKADVNATLSGEPVVNEGAGFREVQAEARLAVPTQFIHMLGFDELEAPGVSGAREALEGIEVVMVLDISNSMNSNNRLINLKPAAREFVDTVMELTESGDVSISVVPYNTQVNAGAALLSHYNVSDEHSYSNCVNFNNTDFSSPALNQTQSLERTGHFGIWYYDQGPDTAETISIPVCPHWAGTEMTVMSTSPGIVNARIEALTANGNTSIDVGMKWAAALLDPGTRPVIARMIADGDVSAANAGRPLDYDEPGVLKVIVVMTDGQNTTQYRLPAWMREGGAGVSYNTDPDHEGTDIERYSIWNADTERYFWNLDRRYHDVPYGDATGTVMPLTMQQLLARNANPTLARDIFAPMMGSSAAWNRWYYSVTDGPQNVQANVKNNRLQAICDAEKDNDVVIYAIGFEATATGNDQLSRCASSPSHFFDADGADIADAFQAIASSIAQLRLTQ